MTTTGFGIDVGGSGVKGGTIDLSTGEMIGDRIKILTPQPSTPDAIAGTVAEIVEQAAIAGAEAGLGALRDRRRPRREQVGRPGDRHPGHQRQQLLKTSHS